MTRLELIAHLTKSMPALEFDALHVYCLVAPGSSGHVTAVMIQRQTLLHIRNCQRALTRLAMEDYLSRSVGSMAGRGKGQPPAEYRLTPKGAALVAQLLNLTLPP